MNDLAVILFLFLSISAVLTLGASVALLIDSIRQRPVDALLHALASVVLLLCCGALTVDAWMCFEVLK